VASVFSERFVALVHDFPCRGVSHAFVVPILRAIYEPVKIHPAPALTMEIVADCLFHEGSLFTSVTPVSCEFPVKS
jgi:hypothetical protein